MRINFLPFFKAARAAFLVLLFAMVGLTSTFAQEGALNGVFTINDNGGKVLFSQGNLQYQASTGTWRFAENQWDYVGSDNSNISESNSGWIDLFGWGTSGYDHGATCYQPWSTIQNASDYYAYGSETYNLFDQTGQADWGYNAISNGGNKENSGWRTPTHEEWSYLFFTRSTDSGIRYAKACVNDVNGVILLHDHWSADYYTLNSTNSPGVRFSTNTITAEQWATLQQHGAVFLSAAGFRIESEVDEVGSDGQYWSASFDDGYSAWNMQFYSTYLGITTAGSRDTGRSVRLVYDLESSLYGINATPSPFEGGTIEGAGTYEEGQTCTLTAVPNADYAFVNWTENGTVVSNEAEYTFTVTENRSLVANFSLFPDPVGAVIVNYYPEGEIPESPFVTVNWAGTKETFETGDFNLRDWQLDSNYPWQVISNNPYEGSCCMKSGGSGVNNVASNMTLTIEYTEDGTISFYSKVSSEANYDCGRFYIDGQEIQNWSGEVDWEEHSYNVTAGAHTFQWRYTKDASVADGDDCFYVDDIDFGSSNIAHYRIYRAECDNDNYALLADNVSSSPYIDESWLQQPVGTYQFGVCGVYNDGSLSPIKTADCIEKHANITVTITAVPNIDGRGSVSGVGDYLQGTTCTLTAIANEGYLFIGWIENGEVVSTDMEYAFVVMGDRHLIAKFRDSNAIVFADSSVEALCVSSWDDDQDGFLSTNEAAAVSNLGEVFQNNTEITSFDELQYFTGLTSIGDYAFYGCSSLASVILPETLDSIGVMSFGMCSSLSGTLTIPESVSFIGTMAFAFCRFDTLNYNAVNCEGFDWSYINVNNTYYYGSPFTLIEGLTTLNLGNQVQRIPDNAFADCFQLDCSLIIPESVTSIGNSAFSSCSGLFGALSIPTSVTVIGDNAFAYCGGLTGELNLSPNISTIGNSAFLYCTGLSGDLNIPEGVTSIGYQAFAFCNGFSGTLTIPESVTSIGTHAFVLCGFNTLNYNAINCADMEISSIYLDGVGYRTGTPFSMGENLTTLNLGNQVRIIPRNAFCNYRNNSIADNAFAGPLSIPNSVTEIHGYAFGNCQGFSGDLVIPNSVTRIEDAFQGCSGFDGTLTIGENVQSVSGYAFSGTGFTVMNYNARNGIVGSIDEYEDEVYYYYERFDGMEALTILNFGENVESVPNYAFQDYSKLVGILTLPVGLKSVGDKAFCNCYGFDGIVMGNSIETIGSEAFRNCGGLRGELTLPETLQSIGTYAFAGCDEINTVNYNAINCGEMGNAQQPVFFDCASIEHINIGSAVESIPNYAFKRCTNVADIHTAAVVPPVIQASTFAAVPRSIPVLVPSGSGDSYRNAQYWEEFFNIMEDGEQYSFYWEVNTHQYAHNLSVIGIVQINGEEQTSSAIEIGAFCGDECRGRQLLTAYPDLNRSLVFLTVFGEEGDLITFRLYDHETEEESSLACATVLTFEADAIVGTYNDPEVLNFVEMQNAALEAGWTWFCAYVDADGGNLLQMMEESLGESGVMIKSHADGFLSYDEYGWDGTLATLNLESMYMVNASAPAVVSLSGAFANVAEHPVTLSPEWNWIGYPSYKAASLNNALEGFNAQDGDVIKMQEAFSQYIEGIGWTGALKTLVPGEGLMYHSLNGSETTLTYTVNAKDDAEEKNLTGEDNHWTPNRKAYPFNMSVVAVVELDGVEAADSRYELAAFDGDECRGSVRLMQVEAIDRYMAFLTVSGNGDAELSWVLYDAETGETYGDDAAGFHFEQNAILGSVKEPLTVRFANLTGADETYNKVLCYPNPVGRSQYVRVNLPAARVDAQVDILNALGAVVSSQRVNGPVAEVKAPKAAGIYVMRVAVDGKNVAYTKLIVD